MVGCCCVLFTRVTPPPCGYCLKASMTDPFHPIDSRLRGNDGEGHTNDGAGHMNDGKGMTPYGLRVKCAMTGSGSRVRC